MSSTAPSASHHSSNGPTQAAQAAGHHGAQGTRKPGGQETGADPFANLLLLLSASDPLPADGGVAGELVQVTMVGWGLWRGERLLPLQWAGLVAASAGLVWLLLPGLDTPPLAAGGLMAGAGVAWAVYTLRGRGAADATAVTAGNFLRATPMAGVLSVVMVGQARWDLPGALLALASGALASGLGYAVWYTALRGLTATRAAIVQLTVPALAAAGGVLLLGEPMSARLLGASLAVLGGVALVIMARR